MYEAFRLNDGRVPIRFDKGRAAFYMKARGEGEVRYTFSMIKHIQNNRPRLDDEQRRRVAKERAAKLRESDPDFFTRIGRAGGKHPKKV